MGTAFFVKNLYLVSSGVYNKQVSIWIYADGYSLGHLFLWCGIVMAADRKRTAHKDSSYKAGKGRGKMLRLCAGQALQK